MPSFKLTETSKKEGNVELGMEVGQVNKLVCKVVGKAERGEQLAGNRVGNDYASEARQR